MIYKQGIYEIDAKFNGKYTDYVLTIEDNEVSRDISLFNIINDLETIYGHKPLLDNLHGEGVRVTEKRNNRTCIQM